MKRLYIVVRNDIKPGLQIAQACHAGREFATRCPQVNVGDNLVVLQAEPNVLVRLLWDAIDSLRVDGVVPFFEPDLQGALTAVALSGDAQHLVGCLPLALRDSPKLSTLDSTVA